MIQLQHHKSTQQKIKAAILGGGLSGLATAYFLNQKGATVEVLEKEQECGGLMKSYQKDDFIFDYGGSHIIFSKNKELLNFLLSILGKNKVKRRRNTKILYANRLVKYPFENGLHSLPKYENFECLSSFIQNLVNKERNQVGRPKNLNEWFYQTFGDGITKKYLIPYNEKIWKYPTDKLGLDWVERIPDPPVEDVVKSSLGIKTEGYTHQLWFHYPKVGGIQAIIKSLEDKLGQKATLNYNVKKIKPEGTQWVISNGEVEKTFDKIISTIPIQKLVTAVESPKEVKKAAAELKYNSLITVMLGINRNKLNNLSWLYIPEKSTLTHRVSFPSNYSPNVAPKEKSSILAEITCIFGDKLWKMTDKQLIDRTVNDLSQLKIVKTEDVCFSKVERMEYAYVLNDLNYKANLKIIKNYFDENQIGLVGRFSEFKYLNMDACVQSAMSYMSPITLSTRKI